MIYGGGAVRAASSVLLPPPAAELLANSTKTLRDRLLTPTPTPWDLLNFLNVL